MGWIDIVIMVSRLVACISCGLLFGYFAGMDVKAKATSAYDKARDKYKERFDLTAERKQLYEITDEKLLSRGIKFRMGSNFSPFDYLLLRILIAILLGILGLCIDSILILPGVIGGYCLVAWYFIREDKYDNGEMMLCQARV